MMAKELAEAMHQHNETLTDPVAKLKARAMSAIILETMLNDEEEEPQQTTTNDKKEEVPVKAQMIFLLDPTRPPHQPSAEEIAKSRASAALLEETRRQRQEEKLASSSLNPEESARLAAAQHETTLMRLFEKGDTLLFWPRHTESKKEEVTVSDTQQEDRASAFVTDEPDDEPKQQAQPQTPVARETKDGEGRSIPILYVRQSCLDATQNEREFTRMISGYHHHCQHQKAPKTYGLKSAQQLRHKILVSYVSQIAKRITDSLMDRCTSFEVRLLDLDLLPVIKEIFLTGGYKCVEDERILHISW